MTNRAQIHEFIFQATVLNFGVLLGAWTLATNFSSVSPKLCQLGQKIETLVYSHLQL